MSAPSRPVESLLARLEGVRRQGGFYRAFCPAHDDRITPNLDIKEGEDGRVLLLCRAGCSTEEVVETLGLTMRDLFSSGGHGGGVGGAVSDPRQTPPPSCTLKAYAEAKRLPVKFLKSLGLSDITYSGSPAIRISYSDREGHEKAVRFRRALKKDVLGDERFRWRSGSRTLPYGLWRLEGAKEVGYVVLVEGESAYHALTAMSERTLAYSEEPIKHRFLVIYEAEGMAGNFATYLMRSLLSEGAVRYETVESTRNGIKPRLIEREGPTGLIVTTTAVKLHPENETRLLSLTVTDIRMPALRRRVRQSSSPAKWAGPMNLGAEPARSLYLELALFTQRRGK